VLPEPFQRWVEQIVGVVPDPEKPSTCSSCAMCAPGGSQGADTVDDHSPTPDPHIYFDPVARCCTYCPQLPNFLVGSLFTDPDPALNFGRETVARRVEEGDASLLGVRIDPSYLSLYGNAAPTSFGQAPSLRCPHHRGEDGGCGIWKHRPAVCATWFCKFERGAVGRRMWQGIFELLNEAERAISLWCLEQLEVEPSARIRAVADLGAEFGAARLERKRDPGRDEEIWGEWVGREIEFYVACAKLVEDLQWEDVVRFGGAQLSTLAGHVESLLLGHQDRSIPHTLRAGTFVVLGSWNERMWLGGYNDYDPLEVGPEVLSLVARCDGRETAVITAEHRAASGRHPDRILLRTLLDHGILVGAGA